MENRKLDDLININDLYVGVFSEIDLEYETTYPHEVILEKTPYTITSTEKVINVYKSIEKYSWYYIDDAGKIFLSKSVKASFVGDVDENGEYDEEDVYDFELYFTDEKNLEKLLIETHNIVPKEAKIGLRDFYEEIKDTAPLIKILTINKYKELIIRIYYMKINKKKSTKKQNNVPKEESRIIPFVKNKKWK